MNWKMKTVSGAMCAAVGALCFGLCLSMDVQGQSQALPDGKGKAEFVHNCTACHLAAMVTRVKKTPEDWRKSVDEMASRGTDGTKQDLDNAYLYLVTNYAVDKSAPAAATPAATPAAPTDIDHVKQLIAANGCLICHRVEQQGAYTGPTLNGLGARRTAAEIRAAIVSPRPTMDPGNDLVSLTTTDGKAVTGRIVSQDDAQVHVMNASGDVATYEKSGLQQFTIIHTNPMPSYEKRIPGADLDGLVRYLGSLPAVDESGHK
jgi:putative heme-binding domain-containing protein